MLRRTKPPSPAELRTLLQPFCQKHKIRRLDIFGSTAHGTGTTNSDVAGDHRRIGAGSAPPSTAELLDMAGEAEELVGVPVGFGQLGRS